MKERSLQLSVILVYVILFLTPFAASQSPSLPALPQAGQVANVTSVSDATESYALYLPSTYTAGKRWPIIYLFDPGGRGGRPVDLYKDVAETYGFILAGSNNSRNFGSDQSKAVATIWRDTHTRLALDERRCYASGFSGGARVAGAMALSGPPGQIAGVIAHGAGYPSNWSGKDSLAYFFAIGDQDFNWPEVTNIRHEREENGSPHRVRVYSGNHQWAPASVVEEAVQYLNLKAMQTGSLAVDQIFVDRAFEKISAEAADAESRKDLIAQLSAYRTLVSDFTGIRDVKEPTAKAAALQQSAGLKSALKAERDQIAEQFRIEGEISPKISMLASGSAQDATALRTEIRQQLGALEDQAKHSKNETRRLVCGRAFNGIFVQSMEGGERELESRHFEKAEAYFDLMLLVSDNAWPALLLADTHAASGNRKLAIKDLQECVRRGLKDRSVIESDPRLQVLKAEPEFQKLLAGLERK